MQLIDKIKSALDLTVKYVFRTEGGAIVELSYIDKEDGKNIICVPTQTMCAMACKFCHTAEHVGKIPCTNLSSDDIFDAVDQVYHHEVSVPGKEQRVLLVSFMGCGEPLFNVGGVTSAMVDIRRVATERSAAGVRFAIATSLPAQMWPEFFIMTDIIKQEGLKVKLHLSLHYTMDALRKEWMPKSLDILPSLVALDFYNKLTGNAVEIHYALLAGINDTEQDAILVSEFLKGRDVNIKFLFYNEKPGMDVHASPKERLNLFRRYFEKYGISYEYYIPPGLDVGASCGQFLFGMYEKYTTKEINN